MCLGSGFGFLWMLLKIFFGDTGACPGYPAATSKGACEDAGAEWEATLGGIFFFFGQQNNRSPDGAEINM